MKPFRVSISATLGVIAVCALGTMGLREGKPIWASLSFCLTLVFLLGATLRALVGPSSSHPGPIGFALFGWVYLATVFGPWGRLDPPQLPQTWGVEATMERLHPQPEYEEMGDGTWQSTTKYTVVRLNSQVVAPKLKPGSVVWNGDANSFRQTAHAMGALIFGLIGLFSARWVARSSATTQSAEG